MVDGCNGALLRHLLLYRVDGREGLVSSGKLAELRDRDHEAHRCRNHHAVFVNSECLFDEVGELLSHCKL